MSEQYVQHLTEEALDRVCKTLEGKGLRYERHKDKRTVALGVTADGGRQTLAFRVDPDSCMLVLYSAFLYCAPVEKRIELSVLLSHLNMYVGRGAFFCYMTSKDGMTCFRVANSLLHMEISQSEIAAMLKTAIGEVAKYSAILGAFVEGKSTLGDALAQINAAQEVKSEGN